MQGRHSTCNLLSRCPRRRHDAQPSQTMHLHALSDRPPAVHVALLAITLLPMYLASYRLRIMHAHGSIPNADSAVKSSANFVREWLDTQTISPYNPAPLARYCNGTEWHPNLVFNLDNANGGIGNVRGNILDFLFFALEAGASILLPGMATRSAADLSNVWAARAPFETFFDTEWFLSAMTAACPQMKIYQPESQHTLATALPGNYLPRSRRMDVDAANTREAYLAHLDAWLQSKSEYQPNALTLVNVERTLWEVDTRSLPPGLRRNFGQLLRTKPAIRRSAALVVRRLAERYALPLDPRAAVPRAAFFGAHLRTEADAKNAGWLDDGASNFTAQTEGYLALAGGHGLGVVYAASGNASELARFRAKAAVRRPPVQVVSKFDLLPEKEAVALRKLSWDQQALVDYEVLLRCSVFSGIVKSSFSYNIALTRNQRREDEGRVMDAWAVLHKEEGVGFDDGISRLLGRYEIHEQRVPRGMWP